MGLNWEQRPGTVPTAPRMPGTSQASQGLDTSFRTTLTLGPLSAETGRYLVKSWEVRRARGSCWLPQADPLGGSVGLPGQTRGLACRAATAAAGLRSSIQKVRLGSCPHSLHAVPGSRDKCHLAGSQSPGDPCSSPAGRGAAGRVVGGESRRSAPPQGSLTQALAHTFPVSLPRPTAKPVFSGQPQPKKRERTCS